MEDDNIVRAEAGLPLVPDERLHGDWKAIEASAGIAYSGIIVHFYGDRLYEWLADRQHAVCFHQKDLFKEGRLAIWEEKAMKKWLTVILAALAVGCIPCALAQSVINPLPTEAPADEPAPVPPCPRGRTSASWGGAAGRQSVADGYARMHTPF